jgi:hypothetical protein
MDGRKLGVFALMFLFGATILVPVLLPDIARADCGAYVRNYNSCDHCAYDGDLLRCDGCAVRDLDRSAVTARDHFNSEYRCNLYGCGWIH